MGPSAAPAGLVGRRREIEAVDRALARAAAGAGSLLVVAGPAGIGKSEIARAAAARGAAAGFAVHRARGWEGPGVPAFWPWVQVVRSMVDAGTDLAAAPGGVEIRRLLDPASHLDGGPPFVLLDGLEQVLRHASAERPQLLVFDDLHAADLSSLDAVHFVARGLGDAPVAILGTTRPVARGEIRRGLAALERDGEAIELAGLDAGEMAELLAGRGLTVPPEVVPALHDATAGNPFFALELARIVAERGAIDLHALPRGVQAAVLEHVELLAPAARAVLVVAAVQGRTVVHDVLAAVHGGSVAEIDDALAAADKVGLLQYREPGIRFVHALVVEALLDQVPAARRQELHRATAEAIARLHGAGQHAEVIASHVLAARDLVTDDEVVAAGRAAAARALARGAPTDAARHLAAAADALRAGGRPDPAVLVDVLTELCEAATRAGRVDEGLAAAVEAADLARGLGDWTRFVRVAIAAPPDLEGIEVEELTRPEQLALREEALVHLPRADPVLGARLMAGLAMSLYWAQRAGGRAGDHRATADRRDQLTAAALALAEAAGDAATRAGCLAARLQALWGPDAPDDRAALAGELIEAAEAAGDPVLAMRGRTWRVVDLLERGRVHEADREIDEFEQRADALRHPHFRWTAARWRATRAIMRGDLDAAEARAIDALALGSVAVGSDVAFTFFGTTLGLVRYLQCRFDELGDTLRGLAAAHPHIPAWRSGLAALGAETGDLALAAEHLEWLAADGFAVLPRDLYWLGGLAVLAPAVLATGNQSVARVMTELVAPFAGRVVLQGNGYSTYGPANRVLGMCAAAVGDFEDAVAALRAAVAESSEPNDPFRALSRYELGRVLLAGGAAADARAELAAAAREFEAIGLTGFAARAREPRPIPWPGPPRGTFRLEGDHWVLQRPGGERILVPDRKGTAMLHALVRLREVTALELAGSLERDGTEGADLRRALAMQSRALVVDDEALRRYRARLVAIDGELDRADRAGDAEASRRLVDERAALLGELSRVTTSRGRPRAESGAAERARVNVTKHLRRAVAEIGKRDPVLGTHFAGAVSTGAVCTYRPDGDVIDWADR